MLNKQKCFFWSIFVSIHLCAQSSKLLKYGDLIEKYSPVVASQRYVLQQEYARKRQALLSFTPQLSINMSTQKRSAICLYPKHQLGLALEQVIFDPAHTIIPYYKEKWLVESKQAALDIAWYNTNNQATSYDIAFVTEKSNQLSTQFLQEYAHTQYDYDNALYKNGLAIEPQVFISKARRDQSDTTYNNTILKQSAALAGLQSTVGDANVQPFGYPRETIPENLNFFLKEFDPSKIVLKASSNNPLIKQLYFAMQAAQEDALAVGWSYAPTVHLFFGCDTQRYSNICKAIPESLPPANWQGGIRVQWEFDGLSRIENRSIALAEYSKLGADKNAAIQDYKKQATLYHTTLSDLSSAISDAKTTLNAQKALYLERSAQYTAGLTIAVEVEKVQADMASTQQKLDELLKQAASNYESIKLLSGYSIA